ncbi:MAG: response regulator transcription factor [Sporolactobacillus sp.]
MRVLIVDDDALVRDSLNLILDLEDDIDVIGVLAGGREAIHFCEGTEVPDLVLMDIRMPGLDGVLATAKLKKKWPKLKVIMLTTFKDDDYIRQAMKNGASGYLLKSQPADVIVAMLRSASKGGTVLDEAVAGRLVELAGNARKKERRAIPDPGLTERESEVLKWIASGKSNKEIAAGLYLSEGTVRNYISRLFEKLALTSRTQLAVYYIERKYEEES